MNNFLIWPVGGLLVGGIHHTGTMNVNKKYQNNHSNAELGFSRHSAAPKPTHSSEVLSTCKTYCLHRCKMTTFMSKLHCFIV